MILTTEPIQLQQIIIPISESLKNKGFKQKNFVTDDGLIVPCIDEDLRNYLFKKAYEHGFSKQRQIESIVNND